MFTKLGQIVAASAVALALATPALAQDRGAGGASGGMVRNSYAALGLGAFDVGDDDTTFEGRLEWQGPRAWWILSPLVGFMATGDGAVYGHAGAAADFALTPKLSFVPSLAAGLYGDGSSGKDLGHVVEFRSQAELRYSLDWGGRIGLAFSHLSNAGLDDRNPGANSLVLTYGVPLNRLTGR